MGSDIHMLFEQQDDQGQWTTMFRPRPHAKYWFEHLIEEKMKNGSAALMFADSGHAETEKERRVVYDRVEEYFSQMTLDEAEERYGSHPNFGWDWYGGMPKENGDYAPIVKHRDYNFFAAISGNRAERPSDVFFAERGTPDDIDRFYRMMRAYDGEDGHTHSWLMLSEMLAPEFVAFCEALDARHQEFLLEMMSGTRTFPTSISEHVKRRRIERGELLRRLDWIRETFPHPERTRMLFHFDC